MPRTIDRNPIRPTMAVLLTAGLLTGSLLAVGGTVTAAAAKPTDNAEPTTSARASAETNAREPNPAQPNADEIQVIRQERVGDRLLDLTVRSPALGDTSKVRLLTPEGWDERRDDRRWPVLYLLPGGNADHLAFTDEYGIQHDPRLSDTLVVMPSMPLYGMYTDWWNDGDRGAPAVRTYHLDELVPMLERDYGAGTRRAIAGESQGGYGALKYAAQRPGMFEAAASYSGFLHPLQYPSAIKGGTDALGIDWKDIWGDPVRDRHRWRANDPYYLADRLVDIPVYISAGDGTRGPLDPPDVEPDEIIPGLEHLRDLYPPEVISLSESIMGDESRAVAYRLRQAGVEVTTHFTRGTHSPPYWEDELDRSLPMLLDSLDDPRENDRVGNGSRPDGSQPDGSRD